MGAAPESFAVATYATSEYETSAARLRASATAASEVYTYDEADFAHLRCELPTHFSRSPPRCVGVEASRGGEDVESHAHGCRPPVL